MIHVLSEYIHSQHIIDKATKEFLLLPKIPAHLYGLPKIHKPGCPLPLLFLGIMIQLTISLPTSPISSIPYLAASYHTSKTQNIFSTSLKNSDPSHSLCSWSQRMSRPIHKHFTRGRHSSRDSLHGRIQVPTTHKLTTTPYSAHHTRFHPKHSTFKFTGTHILQILGTSMGTSHSPIPNKLSLS